MQRRDFITLFGASVTWPLAARAQQRSSMRRIAVLATGVENDPQWQANRTALVEELAKLGWSEGRNLQIEFRFGAADVGRMGALAAELVRASPDVIITSGNAATRAAQQATQTIPIVMAAGGDTVVIGTARNLARPEGNITGFTVFEASIGGKWLELLKEAAPNLTRVALLYDPENGLMAPSYIAVIEAAARALSVETVTIPVRDAFDRGVDMFATAPNGGLIYLPVFGAGMLATVFRLTQQYRLPAMYTGLAAARSGGLISYASDTTDLYRRAASYVDRLLRGAKVSELPVEFPTKFQLVVNLKAAKAIGLAIPESLLSRADEVIE